MNWRALRRAISDLIDAELNPIRVRVRHMVARAVVDALSDGSGFQEVTAEIQEGDDPHEGEHFHEGGLYHHALKGAECVALRVGGNAEHVIFLAVSSRALRPKNKPAGATGLYPTTGPKAGQLVVYIDEISKLHLGSEGASDPVTTASRVDGNFSTLISAISAGFTAVGEGGAASGSAAKTAFEAAAVLGPSGSDDVLAD